MAVFGAAPFFIFFVETSSRTGQRHQSLKPTTERAPAPPPAGAFFHLKPLNSPSPNPGPLRCVPDKRRHPLVSADCTNAVRLWFLADGGGGLLGDQFSRSPQYNRYLDYKGRGQMKIEFDAT